jgi:excisionase family DNA binding protein
MRLVEILQSSKHALRVSEVATLFSVTDQHIYRMAARGILPSLRIAGAIRFDPQDLVNWLNAQRPTGSGAARTSGRD